MIYLESKDTENEENNNRQKDASPLVSSECNFIIDKIYIVLLN